MGGDNLRRQLPRSPGKITHLRTRFTGDQNSGSHIVTVQIHLPKAVNLAARRITQIEGCRTETPRRQNLRQNRRKNRNIVLFQTAANAGKTGCQQRLGRILRSAAVNRFSVDRCAAAGFGI